MDEHITHLRKMSAELIENLRRCAEDSEVECVHDVRTGTRRVQAMAETVARASGAENAELQKALAKWLRELKKVRRAAGPVRDLDVHRKLLDKLVERVAKRTPTAVDNDTVGRLFASEHTEAAPEPEFVPPASILKQQADAFDAWLKSSRESLAVKLRKEIQRRGTKLGGREAEFETALREGNRTSSRAARSAAAVALEDFARLSEETPHLDDANLHDFRKGAKKARYVAESAGEDADSQTIGKTLKKLQDDIGDWHDWLLMAEEARTALGSQGGELIALLDAEVTSHYTVSLKTAARLRGRLMGEWRARQGTPARRSYARKPANVKKPAVKAEPELHSSLRVGEAVSS